MFGRSRLESTAESLEDFVRQVSAIRDTWSDDPTEELWFRGEDAKHAKTALQPKLYRTNKPIEGVLEMESTLFNEYQRCGIQLSELHSEDEFYWYYLMQHHGGPTRLLDWSDGSMMALHFAVRDKIRAEDLNTDALVYVLDPHWLGEHIDDHPTSKTRREMWNAKASTESIAERDRDEEYEKIWLPGGDEDFKEDPLPEFPMLLDTEHITRRVAAQRSRFMVFGSDSRFLNILMEKSTARIRRIRIPAKVIPSVRRDLRDSGVTESVIFPDLDGMGREIRQLWEQFLAGDK